MTEPDPPSPVVAVDSSLAGTLFAASKGARLRLRGETALIILQDQAPITVPLLEIQSIACFLPAQISPRLLAACASRGIAVSWLSPHGRLLGRLDPGGGRGLALRAAQHRMANERRLAAAASFIAAKIGGCRRLLLRGARRSADPAESGRLRLAALRLGRLARQAEHAADAVSLRSVEARAARHYFSVFSLLIAPGRRAEFSFSGRNRRPPLDPVNALLSFGYALILNDCLAALGVAGLDPWLGALHESSPRRPALALDLMEEFRPAIADRLALRLINRGQLGPAHFTAGPRGGIWLADAGRKLALAEHHRAGARPVRVAGFSLPQPRSRLPHLLAARYARWLLQEAEQFPGPG